MLTSYKADITALQEIRWKGCDIISDKKRKGDIYHSCTEKGGMYGVGFVVRGKLRSSVMGWIPVNDRICVLRLKGTFYNTCIICAYAPTDTTDGSIKDTFYDQLDATFDRCPKHDVKIVIGDFNAKLGKEDIYKGVVGPHSLHRITTDNGERLINFAASRELVVSSTCFLHKNIHKGTWRNPTGNITNQIDHVLIDSRHASNVMDVRSYRGANIDSDHYLVMAKIRARISMAKCEKHQEIRGYNIEALKSIDTSTEFSRKVTTKLQRIQNIDSVDEYWQKCSLAITSSATEVLGPIPRRPRKEWFDAECKRAIQEKNTARQKWISAKKTRAADAIYEIYKDARRRAFQLCRARKCHFEDSQMRKEELL
ncbi:craniofacial development protein 2-like protein, partial [Lasius niger]